MSEKYGEIQLGNQNEYIEYYNQNGGNTKVYQLYNYSTSYNGEPNYHFINESNSPIILYDSTKPIIYFKSRNILTNEQRYFNNSHEFINNHTKLQNKLNENNSYLIHVIAIEIFHDSYDFNNNPKKCKKTFILFIDNCCNYYEVGTGNTSEDYYHSFVCNDNISNKKLPNRIIDSIKNIKSIGSSDYIKNFLELLNEINQNELFKIQDLQIKLDEKNIENQDLQTKLDEQLKLNETLCKRLFELKN
jgi:hypothetical protein